MHTVSSPGAHPPGPPQCRGIDGIVVISVLTSYTGTVVRDGLATYDCAEVAAAKQAQCSRHLNLTAGTVNTLVLITSSLTVALSIHYARSDWWITATFLKQLANAKAYTDEAQQDIVGGRFYGEHHERQELRLRVGISF